MYLTQPTTEGQKFFNYTSGTDTGVQSEEGANLNKKEQHTRKKVHNSQRPPLDTFKLYNVLNDYQISLSRLINIMCHKKNLVWSLRYDYTQHRPDTSLEHGTGGFVLIMSGRYHRAPSLW